MSWVALHKTYIGDTLVATEVSPATASVQEPLAVVPVILVPAPGGMCSPCQQLSCCNG